LQTKKSLTEGGRAGRTYKGEIGGTEDNFLKEQILREGKNKHIPRKRGGSRWEKKTARYFSLKPRHSNRRS